MSVRLLIATSACLVAACQDEAGAGNNAVNDPWEERDRAALQLVLKELRDPESAKFRNVIRADSEGGRPTPDKPVVYCGEVNAKNAFGGYAGFVEFAVMGESAEVTDPQIGNLTHTAFCVLDGKPIEGEAVDFGK